MSSWSILVWVLKSNTGVSVFESVLTQNSIVKSSSVSITAMPGVVIVLLPLDIYPAAPPTGARSTLEVEVIILVIVSTAAFELESVNMDPLLSPSIWMSNIVFESFA